jgi:hypothetical protein
MASRSVFSLCDPLGGNPVKRFEEHVRHQVLRQLDSTLKPSGDDEPCQTSPTSNSPKWEGEAMRPGSPPPSVEVSPSGSALVKGQGQRRTLSETR